MERLRVIETDLAILQKALLELGYDLRISVRVRDLPNSLAQELVEEVFYKCLILVGWINKQPNEILSDRKKLPLPTKELRKLQHPQATHAGKMSVVRLREKGAR